MDGPRRKTKIVCTIGPATSAEDQLRALLVAGIDVARLNFSHGSRAEHGAVIARLRRLAQDAGRSLAILQDLAGPKVRIGDFPSGSVELRPGDRFTLTTRPGEGSPQRASVSYPLLPTEVKAGDALLLADGAIQLQVEEVTENEIHTRIVFGGTLGSRKGVNCPSGLFAVPILGEKDLEDLRFGVEHGVDYVGLSFVRTADDVRTAKREIAARGGAAPVIAKIETQSALAHFDDILAEADGVMIARGDLSIETPFARVPTVQKKLIAKANRQGKPVITATHMLQSMVQALQPTRAEVADVANAVLDGSDAVMLSDETTIGRHPVRAVETMAAIAAATEDGAPSSPPPAPVEGPLPTEEAMARAACTLAADLKVAVIGTVTVGGTMAALVAKYRPAQPILAATPRPEVHRRLALVRGVIPLLLPASASREAMMAAAADLGRRLGFGEAAAVLVSRDALRVGRIGEIR